ncbi:urease accessory protein UreE [Aureimonas mangrovi]|uniref:urease accessory protein UreE n=1 Tax=Aureimonas mangrovi TaxID=2758041 RepID=UPI00163D908C|nr:urease accessory protein UreE [Aureimonas mangrovi]
MNSAETIVERGGHEGAFTDTITLDEDQRHRRRMAMVSDGGIAFLLNLAEARLLREGDGIILDDGRVIEVKAKPEPLYEVRGRDPVHLLELAWHLGNRHLQAAISADRILIRQDRVIREMVEGLGGRVSEVEAAFDPAGGAYAGHGHHHEHEHGAPHSHA